MKSNYPEICHDLFESRNRSIQILKEKNLAHVVYAYADKEAPFDIHIMDWFPIEFETDKEFNDYLKHAEPECAMIYSVHSQT